MTIGEFDPTVDGAYRNVITMPLEVRAGKDLYIHLESDFPVDVVLSDSTGLCIGYRYEFSSGTFGPTPLKNKETIALVLGVFRGDLAKITLEVWME